MPTSHTARVLDDEITTVSEFALECSKSFVWSFREGDTLAYTRPSDSYYQEALLKDIAKLAAWDAATEEEKYAQWSDYAFNMADSAEKAEHNAAVAYGKLINLLTEVRKIRVPKTHESFRDFMITQLAQTIDHEGTFKAEYYAVQSYGEWVGAQRGEILRCLRIHTEGLEKSEENNRKSREWISKLAGIYGLEVKESE